MAPLVDPGTDLEDKRPTPLAAVDECMPLFSDVGRGRDMCSLGGGGLAGDGDVDPAVGFPCPQRHILCPRFP